MSTTFQSLGATAEAQSVTEAGTARGIMRLIEKIWHVRGSVPLPAGQTADEALGRIAPLLHQVGTTHQRSGDAITFTKKDPAAQDKLAVFGKGELRVVAGDGSEGAVLRWHLVSPALLWCALAPLFFLAMAQLTIALDTFHLLPAEAQEGAAKPDAKAKPLPPMNPVDVFLGAPRPDAKKPGADKPAEKPGRRGKKPSATPAYVFAGIFAALYVIGRWLEAWLARRLFRRALEQD